jgi:hypothetical protein
MWGNVNNPDAADRARHLPQSAWRPLARETNGRTLARRPTRIVPGPPAWVLRRQES